MLVVLVADNAAAAFVSANHSNASIHVHLVHILLKLMLLTCLGACWGSGGGGGCDVAAVRGGKCSSRNRRSSRRRRRRAAPSLVAIDQFGVLLLSRIILLLISPSNFIIYSIIFDTMSILCRTHIAYILYVIVSLSWIHRLVEKGANDMLFFNVLNICLALVMVLVHALLHVVVGRAPLFFLDYGFFCILCFTYFIQALYSGGLDSLCLSGAVVMPIAASYIFAKRPAIVRRLSVASVLVYATLCIVGYVYQDELTRLSNVSQDERMYHNLLVSMSVLFFQVGIVIVHTLQLEKNAVLRNNFSKIMSHELRTPLAAIIGLTNVYENEFGDEKAAAAAAGDNDGGSGLELVRMISRSAVSLSDILDTMVIYATMIEDDGQGSGGGSGGGAASSLAAANPRAHQQFDIVFLMRSVADTVTHAGLLQDGVALHTGIDVVSTPRWVQPLLRSVQGNVAALRQALLILVNNSCKYTRKGKISVVAAAERVSPSSTMLNVTIHVRDSGTGIPPHQLDKIFQPFYRYDTETPGSGLGLAVLKGIMTMIGGTVSVESEEGRGTVFTIRFQVEATATVTGSKIKQRKSGEEALGGDSRATTTTTTTTTTVAATAKSSNDPDAFDDEEFVDVDSTTITNDDELDGMGKRSEVYSIRAAGGAAPPSASSSGADGGSDSVDGDAEYDDDDDDITASEEAVYTTQLHRRNSVERKATTDQKKTILLVEDGAILRSVAATQLSLRGYDVVVCANGKEAIEKFGRIAHESLVLVVTDYMMTPVNGIEASMKIRDIERAAGYSNDAVPIVVLSAYDFESLPANQRTMASKAKICKWISKWSSNVDHMWTTLLSHCKGAKKEQKKTK